MKGEKQLIMFLLSFAFVIAICGTSAAVTNVTNDSSQVTNACDGSDPVINGTITIKEYNETRPLANATVTVNASNRVLGSATTDANGYYSISFYSNLTTFNVTANYIGCTPVTSTVTVSPSGTTDPNKYGTKNIQLTPLTISWDGTYGSGVGSEYTYQDHGVYIKHYNGYYYAGQLTTPLGSTDYYSYCIDIYTNINSGDLLLVNGPLPGTSGDMLTGIDWAKINYIINTFNPANNSTYAAKSVEGAAIQCAIWYFTSAPYGKYNSSNPTANYQFMTYNNTYGTPYDGYLSSYSASQLGVSRDAVAKRAWQIINTAQTLLYPTSITLTPVTAQLENLGHQTITATVKDQNGNPLSNITVTFSTTSGSLSITSGTTNSTGQLTTILTGTTNSTSTVTASVSGNYGNLLYDNKWKPKQNLVCINLLPNTLADYSYINFDGKANVALTQTVTSPVNVGDQITYVVTATNNGPNNATGILISDILPAGFTATPSAGTTFYNGVWTIPKLNATGAGNSATLTITGIATAAMAGINTTNNATRTSQEQYNELSNTTTAQAYTKLANVTITNTPNQSTLNVGDTAIFTIKVTNNGPDLANIQITDLLSQLPAGFTAGTPSTGSYNPTTGIWTITNLATGTTNAATLTFTGIIQAAQSGTNITNTATETQDEYPFTTTIPNASIYVNQANVTVTQTVNGASSATVNVGDTVTYIITAVNHGLDAATGLKITDILPSGLSNTSYTITGPGTYNLSTGLWDIGTLSNGATAILNITGKATAAMANITVANYANRTAQNEYNPSTNTTSTTVYTKLADVTLTQTGSYLSNVVTFIVTATNNGPDTATNIKITDLIPAGLTGVTVTPSNGLNNYNSTTGVWTIDELLNNGGFATLTITGNATPQSTTNNTATKTNQTEYDPNTPDTTTAKIYTPACDIHVLQYPWYYFPETNTYLYTYNCGATAVFILDIKDSTLYDDATNIKIQYTIGDGFQYIGHCAETGGRTEVTGNTITWYIDYLPKNQHAFMTIYLLVTKTGNNTTNQTCTGKLISVDQYDMTSTYNVAKLSIDVPKAADIALNQTQETFTNSEGTFVKYTITTQNLGPDNATGIQTLDKLPAGLIYTSHRTSNDNGNTWINNDLAYNLTTGIWTIGNFNYTELPKILEITAKINTTAPIQNTAARYYGDGYQHEFDWNPTNNAQTLNLQNTTAKCDIHVLQYPWYYFPKTNTYLYTYNAGTTAVFILDIKDSALYDDATNVKIEYTIGDGFQYIGHWAATGGRTEVTGNTITWYIDYLPKNQHALMTIYLLVTKTGNNTANLTCTGKLINVTPPDQTSTYNIAKLSIDVPKAADIALNQTQETFTNSEGTFVKYTITTQNLGPNNATGIQIQDLLPAGLIYTSHRTSNDNGNTWINNDLAYNLTTGIWTIGNFNYTELPKILEITAKINTTAPIKNTIARYGDQYEFDWNPTNNAKTIVLIT